MDGDGRRRWNLCRPFKEDRRALHLPEYASFPPGDRWCDVLGTVPAGSVTSCSESQGPQSVLSVIQPAYHALQKTCVGWLLCVVASRVVDFIFTVSC